MIIFPVCDLDSEGLCILTRVIGSSLLPAGVYVTCLGIVQSVKFLTFDYSNVNVQSTRQQTRQWLHLSSPLKHLERRTMKAERCSALLLSLQPTIHKTEKENSSYTNCALLQQPQSHNLGIAQADT